MVQNKSNKFDEHQNLLKYLESNVYTHNSAHLINPNVTLIYPIIPWTFWYRNSKQLQLDIPWEESLTKIETVQDIAHLWK